MFDLSSLPKIFLETYTKAASSVATTLTSPSAPVDTLSRASFLSIYTTLSIKIDDILCRTEMKNVELNDKQTALQNKPIPPIHKYIW